MSKLAPIIGIYGKAKIGKSSQLIELCHSGAIATGSSSALLPGQTFLGLPGVTSFIVDNLKALRKLVKVEAPKHKYFGIDDLTQIVNRSGRDWKSLNADIIGLIYEDMIPIRDKHGTCFCITLHEQEERISSNKRIRGGPQLPGQAPEEFSGYLDTVLRASNEETMELWPFVYWSISRPKWIAGDRLSIFPDICPMNIVAGLKLYGLEWKSPHSWMDGLSAKLHGELRGLSDITQWRDTVKPIIQIAQDKDINKYTLPLIKWAARNALHMTFYERARSVDKWLEVPNDVVIG